MKLDDLKRAVEGVLDPHLPFGLRELGMLEAVERTDDGAIEVIVNVPCHHCPGLGQLRDDIVARVRAAGTRDEVRVSFHGRKTWDPSCISEQARAALRRFGVRIAEPSSLENKAL